MRLVIIKVPERSGGFGTRSDLLGTVLNSGSGSWSLLASATSQLLSSSRTFMVPVFALRIASPLQSPDL